MTATHDPALDALVEELRRVEAEHAPRKPARRRIAVADVERFRAWLEAGHPLDPDADLEEAETVEGNRRP